MRIVETVEEMMRLHKEVERPLVNLQARRREVLRMALFGDLDEKHLKSTAILPWLTILAI